MSLFLMDAPTLMLTVSPCDTPSLSMIVSCSGYTSKYLLYLCRQLNFVKVKICIGHTRAESYA